jgi:hypothetical protein
MDCSYNIVQQRLNAPIWLPNYRPNRRPIFFLCVAANLALLSWRSKQDDPVKEKPSCSELAKNLVFGGLQ